MEGGVEERCYAKSLLNRASVFSLAAFGTGARSSVVPGVLSQGRGGPSLAFCVKTGAEPPVWKFPAKSSDWLVRLIHVGISPGLVLQRFTKL